ncbi:MAG: hypothetical protein KJ630_13195 [Proteobacteria bacterium]|nr:hypothetical protein [Pseudomonadota bacterium]
MHKIQTTEVEKNKRQYPEATGNLVSRQAGTVTAVRPEIGEKKPGIIKNFQAFYYDRSRGNEVVYSECVDIPALSYVSKDFHDIPAEKLSAYWVGNLDFPKETRKSINIFESRGKTTLFINGVKIWTGGNRYSHSLNYLFPAGKSKIEVRFESDYFSVGFLLTFSDAGKPFNDKSLTDKLAGIGDYDSMYCGAYEGTLPDKTIGVNIKQHAKPLVLFLSSYEPIIWDFDTHNTENLKAVVLSSKHFGSIAKNLPSQIPVYYGEIPYVTDFIPQSGTSRGQTFKNIALQIQSITSRKPISFSGKYSLPRIHLPDLILDEKHYNEIGLSLATQGVPPVELREMQMQKVFEPTAAVEGQQTTHGPQTSTDKSHPESWANYLHINNTDIPTNAFRAYYCDNRRPGQIKYSETVTYPAVNTVDEKFHDIAAADVNGYWVGTFTADEDTEKILSIAQSSAESAVFIDNKKIWQGLNSSHVLSVNLTKGQHKIELQFTSRSRSTGYQALLTDKYETLDTNALGRELAKIGDFDVMYCGAQKSGNIDNAIPIDLAALKKPTVVFLSSGRSVVWDFQNTADKNLRAVVLSSESGVTNIINISGGTAIYHFGRLPVSTEFIPSRPIDFRNTFKNTALQIQAIAGRKPMGFAGAYTLSRAQLPELQLNEDRYQEIGLTMQTTDFDIKNLQYEALDRVFEPGPQSKNQQGKLIDSTKEKGQPASWGNRLNPSGEVPVDKFKAFYFDINRPTSSIITETVSDVGIQFGDKYEGIPAQSFAAYWVGKLHYSQPRKVRLTLSQSNATSRIYLDNVMIYNGGGDPNKIIDMESGDHLIELEHINNWHTTGVFLSIKEHQQILTYENIREQLHTVLPEDTQTLYAGLYESSSQDSTVTVNVNDMGKPLFLILNSYDPIKWIIQGPGKGQVKAVLLASFKSLSEIRGELQNGIPKFYYRLPSINHGLTPRCSCTEAGYHCEGEYFLDLAENIQFLFHRKVSGYTGKYSADTIWLPETTMTKEQYSSLREEQARTKQEEQECPVAETYRHTEKKKKELPDQEKRAMLELPQVQVALTAFNYIQTNEFDKFKTLLTDELLRSSENQIQDNFVNFHNRLAGVTTIDLASEPQLTYRHHRKNTVVAVEFMKNGKLFFEGMLFLVEGKNGWKVSRF